MQKQKRATSKDVAKLAGVSQSTVSRVFNPKSDREVKSDIREKVEKIAKELGYKPNILARSLASKRSNMIGIVVANPIGPFYSKIITRLTAKLQEFSCQPLFFTLETELDVQNIMDKVVQYQVDGVIITSSALSSKMAKEFIQHDLPAVLFNIYKPESNISCIYSDNIEAGELAAKLLINTDHKDIMYVGYEREALTLKERKKGFYKELQNNGVENIKEECCDYKYEDGYKLGLKILTNANKPDAIFCVSDLIAMGIMDAIKYESDLEIPRDISVIGFDDIEQASWKAYQLTTIHQPIERLINKTIQVLFELINDPSRQQVVEKVSPNLVIRKSTRKID